MSLRDLSKRLLQDTNDRIAHTSSVDSFHVGGSQHRLLHSGHSKSLITAGKSVNRKISSTAPPTNSINDLLNQDIRTMPVANPRKSVGRTKHLPPKGSMESLVCGTAANTVGSVITKSENIPPRIPVARDRERVSLPTYPSPLSPPSSPSLTHQLPLPTSSTSMVKPANAPRSVSAATLSVKGIQPVTPSLPPAEYIGPFGIPWTTWLLIIVGSGCFFAIAKSSTLFLGFICGSFFSFAILRMYMWILSPEVVYVKVPADYGSDSAADLEPRNFPQNPNIAVEESVREFQGWINLLEGQTYDPLTYHVSLTETVFARLEGTIFRMKKPLDPKIPRRAVWDEPIHSTAFVQQIQVNMRNYLVMLQPHGLSHTRIYSKRFPICLTHKKLAAQDSDDADKSLFQQQAKNSSNPPYGIILFARTNKEKEEWYRRLDQASRGHPVTTMVLELQRLLNIRSAEEKNDQTTTPEETNKSKEFLSVPLSTRSVARRFKNILFERNHTQLLIDYIKYMMQVISRSSAVDDKETAKSVYTESSTGKSDAKNSDKTSLYSKRARSRSPVTNRRNSQVLCPDSVCITDCDTGTMWMNAFVQRIFFDFFREEYWKMKIQAKIQKKLDKINLPYYLGRFIIEQFNVGSSLPLLKRIGQPYLADNGIWVDSQLAYSGGANMTVQTKINLNKLKKEEHVVERRYTAHAKLTIPKTVQNLDDDSDDASTSSEEDMSTANLLAKDPKTGEHTVTRFFNHLKDSKYFQKLADTKFVKSALEKVSNTPLKLAVEVKYLSGLFSVTIPPPPTDRIWFGFRTAPEIVLIAKPIVGEKFVNLNKLSAWIEEKLASEFNRELVLPNMIDLKVPVMCGNYKNPRRRSHSRKIRTAYSAAT